MNKYLIVYCHPWNGSFHHDILKQIIKNIKDRGSSYELIDLYHDCFDPAYDTEDLKLYQSGETGDPLVKKYVKLLQYVDHIVFVTPIWWNDVPAILKGFLNKVIREIRKISQMVDDNDFNKRIIKIKKAEIFTTSNSPNIYYRVFNRNGIKNVLVNQTFKKLGIKRVRWLNFGNITHSKKSQREKYLTKILELKL